MPDKENSISDICQSIVNNIDGTDKLLRVVIEESVDEILVISVYYTSKIKNYWSNENEV